MYQLTIKPSLDRKLKKLNGHDQCLLELIAKKVDELLVDPYRFKPLRKPLQNTRRVHVAGCFVLLYEIKEKTHEVCLLDFDHHDKIYQTL